MSIKESDKPKANVKESPSSLSTVWRDVMHGFNDLHPTTDTAKLERTLSGLTAIDYFRKQEHTFDNGLRVTPNPDGSHTLMLPGDKELLYKIDPDGTVKAERNPDSPKAKDEYDTNIFARIPIAKIVPGSLYSNTLSTAPTTGPSDVSYSQDGIARVGKDGTLILNLERGDGGDPPLKELR